MDRGAWQGTVPEEGKGFTKKTLKLIIKCSLKFCPIVKYHIHVWQRLMLLNIPLFLYLQISMQSGELKCLCFVFHCLTSQSKWLKGEPQRVEFPSLWVSELLYEHWQTLSVSDDQESLLDIILIRLLWAPCWAILNIDLPLCPWATSFLN